MLPRRIITFSAITPSAACWNCCSPSLFLSSRTAVAAVGAAQAAAGVKPPKAKVDPKEIPPPTLKDKIKKELITVLKINLVLLPILVIGGLWLYPPVSKKDEARMMDLYKKSAGWKT